MALDDYHPGHTGPHTSSAGNFKGVPAERARACNSSFVGCRLSSRGCCSLNPKP